MKFRRNVFKFWTARFQLYRTWAKSGTALVTFLLVSSSCTACGWTARCCLEAGRQSEPSAGALVFALSGRYFLQRSSLLWILCYAKNSFWCFRPFPETTLKKKKIWQFPFRNLRKFKNLTDFSPFFLFRKKCWNSGEFSSASVNFGQLFVKNQWNFENKTVNMRKSLTKFRWILNAGRCKNV